MRARLLSVGATVALLCSLPVDDDARSLRAAGDDGRPAPCGGAAITPDRVIQGSFGTELMGDHVELPVDVPQGVTQLRVKYCWDTPENGGGQNHTLDLGLYEPRHAGDALWGGPEFRGWGGSSHPDVQLSAQGYGSEADYLKAPKANTPGRTTRGFRPGPIPAGTWAVELGVGAVVPRSAGDADGRVRWRVEVDWSTDGSYDDDPYVPAAYDPKPPGTRGPGWYAGDMHVHAEHSALGDATMRETFDTGFGPQGLDFIALSDYVAGASWSEVGRWQPRYPGKAILRSAEVITYRGHWNSHANTTWADYRTGAVHVRRADGTLETVREPTPPSRAMDAIRAGGGFAQLNHPTIFPSSVEAFRGFCRGCPWDHSVAATDYDDIDAIEVITGPAGVKAGDGTIGPNPFVVTAIGFWQDALDRGAKVAAVGSSDSHNAGRTNNAVTQSPVGEAATVVYADELTERGVQRAVERRHTFVKMRGVRGPDLRLTARVPDAPQRPEAMMGDTVDAAAMDLTATIRGGDGTTLMLMKERTPLQTLPVGGDELTTTLRATEPGYYWLEVLRGTTIEAVSSPIWLGRKAPMTLRATASGRQRGAVTRGACAVGGDDVRTCRAELRIRRAGKVKTVRGEPAELTGASTPVSVRVPLSVRRTLAHRRRGVLATMAFTATDREGATISATRRVRLLPRARPRPARG